MNSKNNTLSLEKTAEEKIEQLENLHHAILNEDLAAVRKLIADGVDVNDKSVEVSHL